MQNWFLVDVCREEINTSRGSKTQHLVLSEDAKEAIANAAIRYALKV